MIMTASPSAEDATTLARLRTAESAEAMFALLGVAYDPAVLRTSRLHILKRLATYLGGDLASLPPDIALAEARAMLKARPRRFRPVVALEGARLQGAGRARPRRAPARPRLRRLRRPPQ